MFEISKVSRALAIAPERENQLKVFKVGDPVAVGITSVTGVPTRKHRGQIGEIHLPVSVEVGGAFGLAADARKAGAWLPVLSTRKLAFPVAQKNAIEAETTRAQFGAVVAAVRRVVAKIVTPHAAALVGRDLHHAFFSAEAAGAKAGNTLFNIIQELTGIKPEDAATAFAVAFRDRVLAGLAKAARAVIFHAPRDISAGGVWTGKLTTRPPAVVLIGFPAIRSVEAACAEDEVALWNVCAGGVLAGKIATGIEAVKIVGLKTFHPAEAARAVCGHAIWSVGRAAAPIPVVHPTLQIAVFGISFKAIRLAEVNAAGTEPHRLVGSQSSHNQWQDQLHGSNVTVVGSRANNGLGICHFFWCCSIWRRVLASGGHACTPQR